MKIITIAIVSLFLCEVSLVSFCSHVESAESIAEITRALIIQLENGDKTAQGKLTTITDEQAFPVFLGALTNPHASVRRTAVYMMRWFKKSEAVEPLALILQNDPDPEIRQKAALSLGLMGHEEAGPSLIQSLEDPHPRVALMAIRGLGLLHYHGAIDVLQSKLIGDNDKDWLTQHEAAEALHEITGQDWSQGIHKYPPDFRVTDNQLTLKAAEGAIEYLSTRIPELIETAKTVQEIQRSEFYYIGYWNSLIQLQGYLLKQEVALREIQYLYAVQTRQRGEIPAIHPKEAEVAYEKALQAYQEFLANTGWHD